MNEKKAVVKRKNGGMSIGTIERMNPESGEIETYTVIDKNVEKDFNFHKIWLMDVLNILNSFGTAKIRVITYLLSQMRNADNTISVGSYREIAKDTGISYPSIQKTMAELLEADVIKKLRTGTFQFNPDIIMQGGSDKRKNLLIRYNYPEDEIIGNKPYIKELETLTPQLPFDSEIECK